MNLKRFGVVLFAVFALGAITASSALATATTEVKPWRTGTSATTTTVLTGTQAITASAVIPATLKTEVAGTPLTLEAKKIECESCTISNESGGAKGEGRIDFTEVSVETPEKCKVKEEKVLTTLLKVDATYMEGTTALVQFLPKTGSTFATVTLERGTGACPISGSYPVTGSVFGKANDATADYTTNQLVKFSESINSTAGGALFFNAKPAILEGEAKFEAGGKYFGVE